MGETKWKVGKYMATKLNRRANFSIIKSGILAKVICLLTVSFKRPSISKTDTRKWMFA